MPSSPSSTLLANNPADAVPGLADVVSARLLRPRLRRFVGPDFAAIGLYANDDSEFLVVAQPGADRHAAAGLRAEVERHRHGAPVDVGPSRWRSRELECAGARVGTMVFELNDGVGEEPVDAVVGMVDLVVLAGYGQWVTSALHEATSATARRAIQLRNTELEQAVSHLRELDELKSSFLAAVSHELRTPLTSVIGFSEMLIKGMAGPLNDEQAEFVRTVLERGEELLELISQLLEISRLEVGAVDLKLQTSPLDHVVERSRRSVGFLASQSQVEIVVDIGQLPLVSVDPHKLQQVVVNLLSNAIKFSPGGGQVRVTAEPDALRRDDAGGSDAVQGVRVTVADEGVGIVRDRLERIFEPFYQVDASLTREQGGVGLGLAISKKLVQAHGGEIWADSELGGGTQFHFTVPIAATG
ncbi:MAG: HAMP domain-containing histidine kinase [Myxococcales bacterium FL481]|nr:MAG: HAMP domain-containing histidine kinase [Myxococcales bacterium FL481]